MDITTKIEVLPDGKLLCTDATIMFKNFSGKVDTMYNANGDRRFTLRFEDPDVANELQNLGWNVAIVKPFRDEPVSYKINVIVAKAGKRLPRIVRHIEGKDFFVDEETINELDADWFDKVDCVITPYEYKPGAYSAYLYQMDVTVRTNKDYLANSYGR